MFHSQDIQVFEVLAIPWFTKSVTMKQGAFLNIFWTTNHEVTKLGQLIDISMDNNFQWSFEQFGRLGLDSRSFLIEQPAPITQ